MNPFCLRSDLLPAPATLEPNDAAVVSARVDDEHQRVVEPVVELLAAVVGQAEPDVEAPVREREVVDVEPRAQLVRAAVPPELSGGLRPARDEQPRRIAQLERQARRAERMRGRDTQAQTERLACEELRARFSVRAEQLDVLDARLTAAPLLQARASLGRVALAGKELPIAHDCVVRRTVEGDLAVPQQDRAIAETLDRGGVV